MELWGTIFKVWREHWRLGWLNRAKWRQGKREDRKVGRGETTWVKETAECWWISVASLTSFLPLRPFLPIKHAPTLLFYFFKPPSLASHEHEWELIHQTQAVSWRLYRRRKRHQSFFTFIKYSDWCSKNTSHDFFCTYLNEHWKIYLFHLRLKPFIYNNIPFC